VAALGIRGADGPSTCAIRRADFQSISVMTMETRMVNGLRGFDSCGMV
jgi:hypothetical protein